MVATLAARRVGAEEFLVDIAAPAGTLGQYEVAVLDAVIDIEFGEARRVAGAGTVHARLALVEADQVGLEPLAPDLLASATMSSRDRTGSTPAHLLMRSAWRAR